MKSILWWSSWPLSCCCEVIPLTLKMFFLNEVNTRVTEKLPQSWQWSFGTIQLPGPFMLQLSGPREKMSWRNNSLDNVMVEQETVSGRGHRKGNDFHLLLAIQVNARLIGFMHSLLEGEDEMYTQSRKKRTTESCISFGEQCRWVNFVVYFILSILLVTCFKFQWSNMTLPGSLDLDPGSQGKPMNSWCVSFETECTGFLAPGGIYAVHP